jgi:hypothetical protein
MKIEEGSRKLTACIIAIAIFTIVLCIILFRYDVSSGDVPMLVFQSAAAYALLCGLFFGSNVLEHYAPKRTNSEK